MSAALATNRATVEQIVREIVLKHVGGPPWKPDLVVSVSARHVHLTDEHVETLFGPGHKLTPMKDLHQEGFYAAEGTVMVVGPGRRRMLPTVFVRAKNIDHAIEMARKSEHGFKHTSIIHSNNVVHMTKMGKALETTPFVRNGLCMAGLGLGGEGYCSFSMAGPTGEGVTTPLTFTRERRCSMIDSLRVLGK